LTDGLTPASLWRMPTSGDRPKPFLVTASQAGIMLGVSWRTVIRMAERGELDLFQKIDGTHGPYLFDAEVIKQAVFDRALGRDKEQTLELDLEARKAG
jgi:hypothetical protein